MIFMTWLLTTLVRMFTCDIVEYKGMSLYGDFTVMFI